MITWTLVIIGWIVVHRTATKRARRQEELDQINDIGERVAALRAHGVAYYTSSRDETTVAVESTMKHELQALASRLRVLRRRHDVLYNVEPAYIYVRKALTGGTFESATRQRLPHGDVVLQEIWFRCDQLVICLRDAFESVHP